MHYSYKLSACLFRPSSKELQSNVLDNHRSDLIHYNKMQASDEIFRRKLIFIIAKFTDKNIAYRIILLYLHSIALSPLNCSPRSDNVFLCI